MNAGFWRNAVKTHSYERFLSSNLRSGLWVCHLPLAARRQTPGGKAFGLVRLHVGGAGDFHKSLLEDVASVPGGGV